MEFEKMGEQGQIRTEQNFMSLRHATALAVMAHNCGELSRHLSEPWKNYFANAASLLKRYEIAALEQQLIIDLTEEEIGRVQRIAASLLNIPKTYATGMRVPNEAVRLLLMIGKTLQEPRNRLPWAGEALAEAALHLKSLGERAPAVGERLKLISPFELSFSLSLLGEAFSCVADEMRLDLWKEN